ncbi:MAG: NUDIX domain-containing protein [Dehalococcoidia bacterium]|nr:NUDIX domain-containing protein [Dehalococcoidia bacterium]
MSPLPLPEPARFCPRCGTPLEGAPTPACPRDGYRWFPDPKVAVGVLVQDPRSAEGDGARLLLVRRNHEPATGAWAFPSGFVDAGEVLEHAAIREVREEANVEVALDGLLGAWSEPANPVVFLAYAGHLVSGTPSPGDEATEVGWFAADALPPLAFEHDGEVVAAWSARRGARA